MRIASTELPPQRGTQALVHISSLHKVTHPSKDYFSLSNFALDGNSVITRLANW